MLSKTSSSSIVSISAVGREGLGTAPVLSLPLPFAEESVFSAPRTGNGLTFADTLRQRAVGPGQSLKKIYFKLYAVMSAFKFGITTLIHSHI